MWVHEMMRITSLFGAYKEKSCGFLFEIRDHTTTLPNLKQLQKGKRAPAEVELRFLCGLESSFPKAKERIMIRAYLLWSQI
jgi:hypothetical protein